MISHAQKLVLILDALHSDLNVSFYKKQLLRNSTLTSPKILESTVLRKYNLKTAYFYKGVHNICLLYFHLFLVSHYLSGI